ncbi:hypothetical protein [Evansella tamaricis]|uniref:Uncharacterized protein n=1 Tax=Evansella tamaricis TaxID=2069301 RepID=A0ABS6JRH0_9BACI|nr:hypothetical protein [Evansella tamaricis]MBU9714893.1 hypothetical protein [Evansella tamaricis]
MATQKSCTTNAISYKNPLLVAFWSLAFPGFGHFLLGSHLFGVVLVIFEFWINSLSSLNTAIYLSMVGDFELAKDIIEIKYFYVYIPLYIFTIWDSYRRAQEMNQEIQLSILNKENDLVTPFSMSILEVNYLRKKNPFTAVFWSFFLPPMVYIYLHRFITLVFSAIWWGALLYYTNITEATYYSLIGEFEKSRELLDPQWVLFLPSVYMFTIFDVHTKTMENNKLYEIELRKYLKDSYQNGDMDSLYFKQQR